MNLKIDKSWSLFLDRDGVINERLPDDYVKTWQQFTFLPGVPEAIKILSGVFGHIFIVTNQQGIGKGLMSENDLHRIHDRLIAEVGNAGGRIDKIYYSPYLASSNHLTRKPAVGMGLKAKSDFSEIRFNRSIMVGDSLSDLIFGKRLKMKTVLVGDSQPARKYPFFTDFYYPDLRTFALAFANLDSLKD